MPVDDLISKLLSIGIKIDDIAHLELLDKYYKVYTQQCETIILQKKEDLIYYLKTWKSILSAKKCYSLTTPKYIY